MGNVAELIGQLISLRTERRTGILMVQCKDVSTSVHVSTGDILFADEGSHGETLGRMLVRQKKLTDSQVDTVASRIKEPDTVNGQLRFAELAAELSLMTMAEVMKALNDQVRFRVMRIFQRLDELSWQFRPHMENEMVFAPGTPGAALRSAVGVIPPTVEELVLDAVRWVDDDHKNELGLFMALGKKLGVSAEDRLAVVRRFALSREETELLSKLDGKRTLGEVLSLAGSVDGPALITALLLTHTMTTNVSNVVKKPTGNPETAGRRPSGGMPIAPNVAPSQPKMAAAATAAPSQPKLAAAATPRAPLTSTAPTPMQVPAVMRPSAAAVSAPNISNAVTRPAPNTGGGAPGSAHNATTTPPPVGNIAARRDDADDPGPQSVRGSSLRVSGTQPAAAITKPPPTATPTSAPTAKPPTGAAPAPGARPSPAPVRPSPAPTTPGTRPSPSPSASGAITSPPQRPVTGSRPPIPPPPKPSQRMNAILTAPPPQRPDSSGRVPSAPPASAGSIPAAPNSTRTPPPSGGRIPTAPPSNPAPKDAAARTSAVMKALEAKRNPGSRPNMAAVSPAEVKLVAEKEFQSALVHFKAFRYADASPGFTRATELVPQSQEYKLYARWNSILQKGAPMQVHDRGEAWRLALAAIAADPNSAFAHYVAGAVAQEDGQKPIAHRYLSRAVALDPQLVDAQRRLRIVDRREA